MDTGKVLLYQHTGSGNHGCEAILRTVSAMLEESLLLRSGNVEEDHRYKVDQLFETIYQVPYYSKWSIKGILRQLEKRLNITFPGYLTADKTIESHGRDADLVLAVGGDVYCYFQGRDQWATDRLIKKKGKKLVLFGCSLEPRDLDGPLAKHLEIFDLIIARESLTYHALQKCSGLQRIALCPDPAFLLKSEQASFPRGFAAGNMVGLNVSPLLIRREKKPGIVMDNLREFIRNILGKTDMGVVLIPHVVVRGNDDRECLQILYQEFQGTGRVLMAEDQNCCRLKDLISKCRFLVTARTHASIAAYSTAVPTLVLGYSVKAKGLARDIFGREENMVLPVEKMNEEGCLWESFTYLIEHEAELAEMLEYRMTAYCREAASAAEILKEVLG